LFLLSARQPLQDCFSGEKINYHQDLPFMRP
jgi:hypothetical protein